MDGRGGRDGHPYASSPRGYVLAAPSFPPAAPAFVHAPEPYSDKEVLAFWRHCTYTLPDL